MRLYPFLLPLTVNYSTKLRTTFAKLFRRLSMQKESRCCIRPPHIQKDSIHWNNSTQDRLRKVLFHLRLDLSMTRLDSLMWRWSFRPRRPLSRKMYSGRTSLCNRLSKIHFYQSMCFHPTMLKVCHHLLPLLPKHCFRTRLSRISLLGRL